MTKIDNKLIADEGMTLTNGEAFGKTVWLANGDYGTAWSEITDEEATERMRDMEEAAATDYEAALNSLGVDVNAE
jgi:hypothetical protein